MSIKIKPITESHVPFITPLFPKEWHFNFSHFLKIHGQNSYFKGLTLLINEKPIGFGNLFIFKKSVWLGNIVVAENHRGNGYGKLITKHLIDTGKELQIETFNLIATDMGKQIYEKLGFRKELNYEFYSSQHKAFNFKLSEYIVKAERKDLNAIIDFNCSIIGENREELLKFYLPKTYLTYNDENRLRGFYIDDPEGGSILSDHKESGIELLKLKLNLGSTKIIIPETNTSIKGFLRENGFKIHKDAPKMILGEKYEWQPKFIYNRGAGYCA